MNISVIGLGKLGSPMVATMADAGHTLVGVDVNPAAVSSINAGKAPVVEPLLSAMLRKNRRRISATADINEAVAKTDITFVIVPTPSRKSGDFETSFVVSAMKNIGSVLRNKKRYHLVVLTSTVLPGASARDVIPALERTSGKKVGKDFGFCYNPEFVALGSVVSNLLNADFILIGESDKKAGSLLEKFYKSYCDSDPPVHRMSVVNAELTKISVNAYITAKISFANLLAQMCHRIDGGDVDIVTEAIGADTRIGRKYLRGATGFGGPCFPRDNRAMRYLAGTLGISHHIARSTDAVNESHLKFLTETVTSHTKRGDNVAILGVSYKPDTGVIEESQSVLLAAALLKAGRKVTVYDPSPEAMAGARGIIPKAQFAPSMSSAVRKKNVICIATPWKEFRSLTKAHLTKGTVVLDFWRHVPSINGNHHRHVRFGKNNNT